MTTIQSEHFTKAILMLLEEAFENVQGIFLDKNTSMFETLAGITSDEASIPVGGKCATLAAQVKHVSFYLDKISLFMQDRNAPNVDWGEIWRTVSAVSSDEWQAIQTELRLSYMSVRMLIESKQDWPDEDTMGIAMALVVHSAYHLGEIRQAMCVL
ncbi:MAG TPA: hypothetical protein DIW44_14795 [Anaerolineaceae bacterium]|nr:hypothetical protein [Anaerolineaceae bacterium]